MDFFSSLLGRKVLRGVILNGAKRSEESIRKKRWILHPDKIASLRPASRGSE
jgi:hypothetical protein